MFKSIKELFSNNQKHNVKSVKRIVFDTDCKITVSGFFKIKAELITDKKDKEQPKDTPKLAETGEGRMLLTTVSSLLLAGGLAVLYRRK